MRAALLTLAAIFLAGCSSGGAETASANAKRYPLKGKVISADRTTKTAKIEHEEIPGFMDRMTMEFPIRADWAWDDLKPGAEIRAELVVDNAAKEPYYLDKLGIIAAPDPNRPVEVNTNFAQVGQVVPDFTLTNQDGKKISIKDFRGKALAITFIYARCPLPDYCIRMSTAFSDVALKVMSDPDLSDKIRLLSISFDPENDTPEKLRSYGIGYLGNDPNVKFGVWQLAVGKEAEVRKIADFFGLWYERDEQDKTQFSHSLRTAVIDPDGKVTKILAGSDWSPAELLRDLQAATGE